MLVSKMQEGRVQFCRFTREVFEFYPDSEMMDTKGHRAVGQEPGGFCCGCSILLTWQCAALCRVSRVSEKPVLQ